MCSLQGNGPCLRSGVFGGGVVLLGVVCAMALGAQWGGSCIWSWASGLHCCARPVGHRFGRWHSGFQAKSALRQAQRVEEEEPAFRMRLQTVVEGWNVPTAAGVQSC